MKNPILWLLKRPDSLNHLAIASAILPYLIARIEILQAPMTLVGIMLLLTINWDKLIKSIKRFFTAHYWIKIQIFWFMLGMGVVGAIIYSIIDPFIPTEIYITALFVLAGKLWFERLNEKLTNRKGNLIFRSETKTKNRVIDFEIYLLPLLSTFVISTLFIIINSLAYSRGIIFFKIDLFYWYFTLVVLLFYYTIDALFIDQLIWHPKGGVTQWKENEPPDVPDVADPLNLAEYFGQAQRTTTPQMEIFDLLEDNLEELVAKAQKVEHYLYQVHMVRTMMNWGEDVKEKLHIPLMIVLSSVSQYRVIGLIPIYKRKLFYSLIQLIPGCGAMTPEWRDIIDFEIDGNRDKSNTLNWIIGKHYKEENYPNGFLLNWDGLIFKGKEGYYEAAKKREITRQTMPRFNSWEREIWELCLDYVTIFVGESGGSVMSRELGLFDQLKYMSKGFSEEEYHSHKEAYKQELQSGTKRLVQSSPKSIDRSSKQSKSFSQDEKLEAVNEYLSYDASADSDHYEFSITRIIEGYLDKLRENITSINYKMIIKLAGLITTFALNIFIIYLVDIYLGSSIKDLLIALEIVILFIMAITPSNSDMQFADEYSEKREKLKQSTLTYKPIQVNTSNTTNGIVILIYTLCLLFVVQLYI